MKSEDAQKREEKLKPRLPVKWRSHRRDWSRELQYSMPRSVAI